MLREELIARAAADAGVQKTVAGAVLNSLLHNITAALKRGDKVSLVGFGTFSVGHRKARMGKIPGTKKEIIIPAAKVPKFKPGKDLKEFAVIRVSTFEEAFRQLDEGERVVMSIEGRDIALISVEELQMIEEREDRIDLEAVEAALAEGGEPIPYEKFVEEMKRKRAAKRHGRRQGEVVT